MNVKRFVISAITVFISAISMGGCNRRESPQCNHEGYKYLLSTTATCTEDGIKTYQCSNCGETFQEYAQAIGHNWNEKSNTATCTEAGTKILECTSCHEEKTENVDPLGHDYDKFGHCSRCDEFKYHIQFDDEFPTTKYYGYEYSNGKRNVYSMCRITEIMFVTQNDYIFAMYFGTKTYDRNSETGTEWVEFQIVLKDESGNIITSDKILITGLIMNQRFGDNGYYAKQLIKGNYLDVNKTYTLFINDVFI